MGSATWARSPIRRRSTTTCAGFSRRGGTTGDSLPRQEALVDHRVDVHRLLQPLQLVEHERREPLQAVDVDARVRVALPVGVLEVDVDRRAYEAGLVQVALRLLHVGEVVL